MYTKRIVSKVPGHIPAEPKKEKQGYLGDLSQKTIPQLNELLERQEKLLANKQFISKLADKGEKITKLKETIEAELKKRNESENLSRMLSMMSMNGKEDLENLEWTGLCAPGYVPQKVEEVEDDDDERNPLKILATHSGAGFHKKKHRVIQPEKPLIKPSDLINDDSEEAEDKEILEEYAKHLCEKMDSLKSDSEPKTKFFPHKTLKNPPPEPKKAGKQWEVTAATPPLPVHGDSKLVSLQESIKLQFEQQQKLKEIQIKHAAERLAASKDYSVGRVPVNVGSYREPVSETSSEDEQDQPEVYDEEHPDGGGVTIYNLVDDDIEQ